MICSVCSVLDESYLSHSDSVVLSLVRRFGDLVS